MQGTRVWTLVWEDPTCHGATKPTCHNYWACTLEPASHNYWSLCTWSLCSATREATATRSLGTATKSSPLSLQLEKARVQQRRLSAAKNKINKINKLKRKKFTHTTVKKKKVKLFPLDLFWFSFLSFLFNWYHIIFITLGKIYNHYIYPQKVLWSSYLHDIYSYWVQWKNKRGRELWLDASGKAFSGLLLH